LHHRGGLVFFSLAATVALYYFFFFASHQALHYAQCKVNAIQTEPEKGNPNILHFTLSVEYTNKEGRLVKATTRPKVGTTCHTLDECLKPLQEEVNLLY